MVRRDVDTGGRRRKSRDALTSRPEIERLLDAARAPASPRELAGEQAAVDLFARARLVASPAKDELVATRSVRTGLKAALAAVGAVGLLSSGVSFAATGHVPFAGTISKVTHSVADKVTGNTDDETAKDNGKGPKGTHTASPNGPKVAALQGLCHAYNKGNKAGHGNALKQRPFQVLVTAAGGEDQVAGFCASLPAKTHPGGPGHTHPTHPTHPTTGPSTHPTTGTTHPAHPSHPTHPVQPTHPTKKPHPTQASSPTHKPHPTHPTRSPHPSQPTKKPHPSQGGN